MPLTNMDSNPDSDREKPDLVREHREPWPQRYRLVEFIEEDIKLHPEHRPAYEAVAAAFGFKKE